LLLKANKKLLVHCVMLL